MKLVAFFIMFVVATGTAGAQQTYTITADSTKLTGCDSNEFILENHTQNVKGFLYNTGNGRTVFKRGLVKVSDSLYLIGADSLRVPQNAWVQGGNRFGTTGMLGTLDSNHLDFYTNNVRRGRWSAKGNLLIGTTLDNSEKFQVTGNGTWSGPLVTGTNVRLGDSLFNNVLSLRIYGDTLAGISNSNHYAVIGQNVLEPLSMYNVNKQGGAVFFDDRTGILPLRFMVKPTGATVTTYGGGFTPAGNLLLGSTNDSGGYKLQIKGGLGMNGGVFTKRYYTDVMNATLKIGSGYELYGVNHASGGYTLYFSGGITGSFDAAWDMAFGNPSNRIMVIKDSLITTNRVLSIAGGAQINTQSTYFSSPYVGFKYLSDAAWCWAVVNSSNTPNFIVHASGNVLVGTTTDNGNKLQVGGNGYFNGNVGIGVSSPGAQLHTTGTVRFAGLTNLDTLSRVVVCDANGKLYFRNASSLAMNDMLRSSLAVNGPIKAKSLTLSQTGWPDYVFDSTYRLRSLKEVEGYIREHNHLPDVPSAASVEKEGLSVGEAQAALLKKIEELTLYNIAGDKKIEELKQMLEKQLQLSERQTRAMELMQQRIEKLEALNHVHEN